MFVIGCSELNQYLLAVEYKHQVEPLKVKDEVMNFESLEQVKEALVRLGVERAYLRLQNAYDECGAPGSAMTCDVELPLVTH